MRAEFQVHQLNDQGLEQAELLAEAFSECLDQIAVLVPPGRDLALVITKMQEAAFFAKRGVATKPENQLGDMVVDPPAEMRRG